MCFQEYEEKYYLEKAKEFVDNNINSLIQYVEISDNYPFIGYDYIAIKDILEKTKINNISDLTLFSYIVCDYLIDKLNNF